VTGTLPTANGGTNLTSFTSGGVVYASSSSALATGSGLVFDGSSLAVGTTSATAKLTVINASDANKQVVFGDSAIYYGSVGHNSGTGLNEYRTETGGGHGFYRGTSGTADLALNSSGNLGIGTTSPAYKLDLYTTAQFSGRWANATRAGYFYTDSGGPGIFNTASYGGEGIYLNAGSNYIQFIANSVESMRLNSSGQLGIGTTSPSTSLTVSGANTAARGQVSVIGASTADPRITLYRGSTLAGAISCTSSQMYIDAVEAVPLAFYTSDTERARIGSTGNLVVGLTDTTYAKFAVFGVQNVATYGDVSAIFSDNVTGSARFSHSSGVVKLGSDCALAFGSGSSATERARFTTTGDFLVGATTNFPAGDVFQYSPSSSNAAICHSSSISSGTNYIGFLYNGSTIGSITQSGTTAVLYNVTSDQRLKENIVDAPEFGSVIDSIQVRSFDWKADQTHQRAGFIAQELVTVAPEAVHQPNDTEDMMAVDYSKLVPMLVKEIQSLRQRLSAANL
jgi:hypothetical protein